MTMLRLKFQSTSDVITNSSSEIFQLKSNLSLETVREMIETEGRKNREARPDGWWELPFEEQNKFDCCSGVGGELSIYGWEDIYKRDAEWRVVDSKRDQYTPEIWALGYEESLDELKSMIWVDIDWSRYATIKFVLENFWVVGSDSCNNYWQKDPETNKCIRIITKEIYDTLPENCRDNY